MNRYTIRRQSNHLFPGGKWDDPIWGSTPFISIDSYRIESSDHRPITQVKALHDGQSANVLFKVTDRFVRCTRTRYLSDVWKDSCVEWFAKPRADKGYINFEANCGGTLHASYVEDPTRVNGALKKATLLPAEIGSLITIGHSLPSRVDPEITLPLEWFLEMKVPLAVFEHFTGPLGNLSGQTWRANFNKCADESSHPAWATWNPVSEFNFHRPEDFGVIVFE